jgi:hypothetical protein
MSCSCLSILAKPKLTQQGVCHIAALPFTLLKSILRRQKKNYGNSNTSSPCKNIIFKKKIPLEKPKSFKIS